MFKSLVSSFKKKLIAKKARKKSLFIHAGTYKTGTTYFQHRLYHNRERLREAGIYYPVTGLGLHTNHNRFAHRVLGVNILTGRKYGGLSKILTHLQDTPEINSALISYEGFGRAGAVEKIKTHALELNEFDVHAMLVFRPHMDFALSLYRELCQHVLFGAGFTQLFDATVPLAQTWSKTLEYRSIIEAWQGFVGRRQLHVHSYRQIKSDLVGTLMKDVGYEGALEEPDDQKRNLTLSAPGAKVMRRINAVKMPAKLRHAIAQEVGRVDKGFPSFSRFCEITEDQARSMEQRFEADREYLRKFGFDPKADLMLGDSWRWGTDTNMDEATDELHDALIVAFDDKGEPMLQDLVRKARIV